MSSSSSIQPLVPARTGATITGGFALRGVGALAGRVLDAAAWRVTLAAAALMALGLGGRSAFGLFVSPLNSATGMGLPLLSLALAVGQLAVGFAQPVLGALADRFGGARVVAIGALVLAAGLALPAWGGGHWTIASALVLTAVAASAVGSNGVLIGEVNRAVPKASAGLAVGIVGAGASVGQLVLGPTVQWLIDSRGWITALLALAALSLSALALARALRRDATSITSSTARSASTAPIGDALRQRRFWCVAASFGACGLHVGFMSVHMPGVIERCGLPASLAGAWLAVAGAANIAGSVAVGWALRHRGAEALLASLYVVRATAIAVLLLGSVSASGMLLFALVMGASHMATLPPTAQMVARDHGVERLGTLFGVVMLVHQLGSFAGIALGGWAAEATGSDTLLWCVDLALALAAAWLVRPRVALPLTTPHSPPAVAAGRS